MLQFRLGPLKEVLNGFPFFLFAAICVHIKSVVFDFLLGTPLFAFSAFFRGVVFGIVMMRLPKEFRREFGAQFGDVELGLIDWRSLVERC